jgi:hypothetical protein
MEIRQIEYPSYATGRGAGYSWLAVYIGAAVSLAGMACLSLLGLGITAIKVPTQDTLMTLRGIGAFWVILSAAVSFYAGGWVASRLAGVGRVSDSVIHGLGSWGTASVAALVLVQFAGGLFFMNGVRFNPGSAIQFAWAGFIMLAVSCATACLGARSGARLLMPVPIDQYQKTKARETARL